MNTMITQAAKPEGRAQVQTERILNAAEDCFIKHGFHAASMANISEAAGMSPGLIYRYFENKSSIIKAIITRQLAIMREDIGALVDGADFTAMIVDMFTRWRHGTLRGMSPILYLELSAEAFRDPEIAEAVALTDKTCTTDIHAWLKQLAASKGHNLSSAQVEQCDFILRCFLDGLAVRATRASDLDGERIAASLELLLSRLVCSDELT